MLNGQVLFGVQVRIDSGNPIFLKEHFINYQVNNARPLLVLSICHRSSPAPGLLSAKGFNVKCKMINNKCKNQTHIPT